MRRFWGQEDLWLKVFSLLVSLIIWVYVASRATPSPEVGWRVSIPLEVRGVPARLAVVGVPPTVDVSLVAPAGQEAAVKGQVRAVVSLEGLGPGHHRLAVRVPQPPAGRVVGVSPRWVEADLGRVGVVRRSVAVELEGAPAPGYEARTPQVTPAEVGLAGIESLLARVAEAKVEVELTGATADLKATAAVVAVDAAGKPVAGVAVEPAEVEVTVPVVPAGAAGPGAGTGTP